MEVLYFVTACVTALWCSEPFAFAYCLAQVWQQKLFAVLHHGMEVARLQQILRISAEFHTTVLLLKQ